MQTPKFLSRLTGRTGIIAISVFLNFSGFTLIIPVLPFSVGRYVPELQYTRIDASFPMSEVARTLRPRYITSNALYYPGLAPL